MEAIVQKEKPKNDIWHSVSQTVDEILNMIPDYLKTYLDTQLAQGKTEQKEEPSVQVKKEEHHIDIKTIAIISLGLLTVILIAKGK